MQFCPMMEVSFFLIRLVLPIWGKEAGRDSYPEFPDVIIPIDDSRSPTEHYNSDWKCTMTQFSRLFFHKIKNDGLCELAYFFLGIKLYL